MCLKYGSRLVLDQLPVRCFKIDSKPTHPISTSGKRPQKNRQLQKVVQNIALQSNQSSLKIGISHITVFTGEAFLSSSRSCYGAVNTAEGHQLQTLFCCLMTGSVYKQQRLLSCLLPCLLIVFLFVYYMLF